VTADVVVVTFNGREVLASCLERLRAQTHPHALIVVDNGSSDGSSELVRERFPEATLVALPENRGFGRGVAAGVAAGRGEAIVLLNDDVEVEPRFVEAIVAPLETDPGVGMVAGLTTIPGTDLVDGFGIELDVTLAAYNRLRRRPLGETPGVLAMPSGGAAAYRRTAFEAAGGFDDALFAYGEDVDLGLRLRAAGWRTAAAPGARGVHLGGATAGVDSPAQRRLAGFARGFLLRRYGVLRSTAAPRALLVDSLVVAWGLVRFRTAIPLRARLAGWRAAGATRMRADPSGIDRSITLREALRRLRQAR
jgi:N-acetylglucosaminyl-diphospho-decaprenol L-rhamnosyltransferase